MSKYSDFINKKINEFSNSIQNAIGNIKFNNNDLFSNQILPHRPSGNEIQFINSMLPDKGFANPLTNPVTPDYEVDDMVDLDDCVKVRRTIENCRKAMKIEPYCRASALMMMILVSSDFEIYGMEGVDRDVLNRVQDIARDVWELESKIFGMAWRTIVDGKFYMNKVVDKKSKNLLCEFLAYDAKNYDFIKLQEPLSQEVKGYIQKAIIWKYPKNWNKKDKNGQPLYSFDQLANPQTEVVSIPLLPEQVVYGDLFEDGEGLVMGILDDVWALKRICNAHPGIIETQLGLMFVQMGSENYPYMPFNDYDDDNVQKRKLQEGLDYAQETFIKGIQKGVVVGTQDTNPSFVGSNNIGALNLSFATTIHAHRIFIGLLTPPARWEGSGTNKASVESQIGESGQYSAVYFLQNMIKRIVERDLINHQIELLVSEFGERAKNSIDKIGLRFKLKNLEDRKKLAEVFQILETFKPSITNDDFNMRLETYFPEFYKKLLEKNQISISNANYSNDKSKFNIPNEIKVPEDVETQLTNGIIDTSRNNKEIHIIRNYLIKKGVFK